MTCGNFVHLWEVEQMLMELIRRNDEAVCFEYALDDWRGDAWRKGVLDCANAVLSGVRSLKRYDGIASVGGDL